MRGLLTFRAHASKLFGYSGAPGRSLSSIAAEECVPRPAMKYLNVAEKNDAAKTIAGHLSRGTSRRREGLSPYNKIYEFEAEVQGQKCLMTMTSVSGHLLGYEFVGAYKVWQSCDPLSLFEAPVAKICPEDYSKIKLTLEREIRGCGGLIIWTDCDREGENIGFEIIQTCTAIKKNLKIYRAKFSEITAASVNRALRTLGEPDKKISDAVDVRQELDLRIGAAFTRFQTLRLQKVFPQQLANSLISYGSCQFPTLGFVVERYRAVESFIAENFWKISVSHECNELKVDFSWKRSRLFDEPACLAILDICKENPTATVETVKSKPKSKWRPLPLDTVEMEKLGSRKLRINAKEVMKIAEKLYTRGIISYPRTETNIYPKELNLGQLVGLQTADSQWGAFAQGILDGGGPTPRQGKKSDQAHPPIHPTKHATDLSGDEKKVYELVVRSFLACCSKDAQGQETAVDVDIAGEKFTASGLMIIARNYLDVYPYDRWTAKEIHIYREGQTFVPTFMDITQGQTSAPPLLTEADLIALMEKHGIGTDATHADHIETIKSRSYVALADNIHFVPGLLGMGLVEGYDSMGLSFSKPHLRAGLEADLKAICDGNKNPQTVLSDQIATYRNVYITVTRDADKIDQALSGRFNQTPTVPSDNQNSFNQTVMKCSSCRSDMTLRPKKDNTGFYIGCMGYPQCRHAIWLPSTIETVRVTNESCEACGPHFKKLEFTWKNRSLEYRYPPPYVSCIGGCDYDFMRTLNINPGRGQQTLDSGIGSTISQTSTHTNSNTSNTNSNTVAFNGNTGGGGSFDNSTTSTTFPANGRSSRNTNGSNDWPRNEGPSTKRPRIPPSNSANPVSRTNGDFGSTANDDNHVVCSCGEPAVLLTVRKATANMGRKFYKCPKPKENGGCNFFLWEDSGGATDTNTNNFTQNPSNANTSWGRPTTNQFGATQSPQNNGSNSVPNCQCNLPAKTITVFKEGPNKGRPFYCCPNPMTNRCNFFQWADAGPSSDANPSTSWGGSAGSSNNYGNNNQRQPRRAPTGERAKKKCGNCRQEGHTRTKCPLLRDDQN